MIVRKLAILVGLCALVFLSACSKPEQPKPPGGVPPSQPMTGGPTFTGETPPTPPGGGK